MENHGNFNPNEIYFENNHNSNNTQAGIEEIEINESIRLESFNRMLQFLQLPNEKIIIMKNIKDFKYISVTNRNYIYFFDANKRNDNNPIRRIFLTDIRIKDKIKAIELVKERKKDKDNVFILSLSFICLFQSKNIWIAFTTIRIDNNTHNHEYALKNVKYCKIIRRNTNLRNFNLTKKIRKKYEVIKKQWKKPNTLHGKLFKIKRINYPIEDEIKFAIITKNEIKISHIPIKNVDPYDLFVNSDEDNNERRFSAYYNLVRLRTIRGNKMKIIDLNFNKICINDGLIETRENGLLIFSSNFIYRYNLNSERKISFNLRLFKNDHPNLDLDVIEIFKVKENDLIFITKNSTIRCIEVEENGMNRKKKYNTYILNVMNNIDREQEEIEIKNALKYESNSLVDIQYIVELLIEKELLIVNDEEEEELTFELYFKKIEKDYYFTEEPIIDHFRYNERVVTSNVSNLIFTQCHRDLYVYDLIIPGISKPINYANN